MLGDLDRDVLDKMRFKLEALKESGLTREASNKVYPFKCYPAKLRYLYLDYLVNQGLAKKVTANFLLGRPLVTYYAISYAPVLKSLSIGETFEAKGKL